jgi:hypothetical protein
VHELWATKRRCLDAMLAIPTPSDRGSGRRCAIRSALDWLEAPTPARFPGGKTLPRRAGGLHPGLERKGQVENPFGLVRERFFTPRLRFKTYEEMDAWLLDKCIAYAKAHPHPHPELAGQTIWESGRSSDGFHAVPASVSNAALMAVPKGGAEAPIPWSAPLAGAIAPTSGPTQGGTTVTITSAHFTGATAVTFGGAAATGMAVVNATTISALTPAHAAGVVDVAVTTPGGTRTGTGPPEWSMWR